MADSELQVSKPRTGAEEAAPNDGDVDDQSG